MALALGLALLAAAGLVLVLRPTAEPAGRTVAAVGTVAAPGSAGAVRSVLPAGSTTVTDETAGPEETTGREESAGAAPTRTGRPAAAGDGAPSGEQTPDTPTASSGAAPGPLPESVPVPSWVPVPPSAPVSVSAPVEIVLPSLGVTAPVEPVGVDDAGLMQVPSLVSTVGWYRFGPTPGAAVGSAVITGHVDTADQGPGVFAEIGRLEPGDPIRVTDSAGTTRSFVVTARESWPKDDVPLGRLFDRTGAGRLVLITCGGAFDPQARSYDENVAVTAVPTD